MDIVKRNLPVFIIGGVTLAIFLGIIFLSQRNTSVNGPTLSEANQEELIASHTYTLGDPSAPVYLVEFSDFECPFCQTVHPIVQSLYEQYPGQLYIAYRHFPLPYHPDAREAAKAAQAAGTQGKFWEYSTLLFENNTQLKRDNFIEYARQLEMDIEKFTQDLDDPTYAEQVNEDYETASRLNLAGTPTFFLNGKLMQFDTLQDFQSQVIEAINSSEGVIENNSDEKETQESSESVSDESQTLNITFTNTGFSPQTANVFVGQKVRFINETDQELVIEQPEIKFEDFGKYRTIPAGGQLGQNEFEYTLTKEGVWNFRQKDSQSNFGSLTIYNRLPKE